MRMLPIVVATLFIALSSLGETALAAERQLIPPSHIELQRVLNAQAVAHPGTGVMVGIIDRRGTTMLKAGSSGTSRPLDEHSLFEIGSITKTFTATVLAGMVRRHEINLSAAVQQFLPRGTHVPTRNGKTITLLMLATHYSGLPRDPSYSLGTTWVGVATFLGGYRLTRDPGSRFEYSNLGGAILGNALADEARVSYTTLVRTRVFEPLGMRESSAAAVETLAESLQERVLAGHYPNGAVAPATPAGAMAPAGAIRSSVSDMLRFVRCNLGQGPLAEDCLFAQQSRAAFPGNRIGLIWWIGDYVPIIRHEGDTRGFRAAVAIAPTHSRGVVVLANGDLPAAAIAAFAIDSSLRVPMPTFRKPQAPPRRVTLHSPLLAQFTGEYAVDPGAVITVTRDGASGLFMSQTGQLPIRAYATARDHFYIAAFDVPVDFTRDSAGRISALVLRQHHQIVIAERINRVLSR